MRVRPDEIIRGIAWTALLSVPVLSVLAYLDWRRSPQTALSRWRNLTGAGSVAITLVAWAGYALATFASLGGHFKYSRDDAFLSISTLAIVAAVPALAWRGRPRIVAAAAACLLIGLCASFLMLPG